MRQHLGATPGTGDRDGDEHIAQLFGQRVDAFRNDIMHSLGYRDLPAPSRSGCCGPLTALLVGLE